MIEEAKKQSNFSEIDQQEVVTYKNKLRKPWKKWSQEKREESALWFENTKIQKPRKCEYNSSISIPYKDHTSKIVQVNFCCNANLNKTSD